MKLKFIGISTLAVFMALFLSTFATDVYSAADKASDQTGVLVGETEGSSNRLPVIFYPETKYHFEEVLDGTSVTHDFVIQNKGDAPLNIQKVKTG